MLFPEEDVTVIRTLAVFLVLGVLGAVLYQVGHPAVDARAMTARAPGYSLPTTIPSGLPGPSPDLTPSDVLRTIVAALKHNDEPVSQAGIIVTYMMSSPENRQAVGPLPRFVEMVHSKTYAPFLNHRSAEFGRARVNGNRSVQMVTVYSETGESAYFLWELGRQEGGEFKGCWMTEGVMRLSPAQGAGMRKNEVLIDI